MKYLAAIFLFHIHLCFSQTSTAEALSDSAEIKLVYTTYTKAILEGNGEVALKHISRKTIDYYDTLIYHVLYSDEEALSKINILSRTAILRMRHTKSAQYWDTATAKKVLVQMWTSEPPPKDYEKRYKVECTRCEIECDEASCQLTINGKPSDMKFAFHREYNAWKIDINSINPQGIEGMTKNIKEMNLSETDYILLTLKRMDKVVVAKEDLYTPLKKSR